MNNDLENYKRSLLCNIEAFGLSININDLNQSTFKKVLMHIIPYAFNTKNSVHTCLILSKNIKRYNKFYPYHTITTENNVSVAKFMIHITIISMNHKLNPDKNSINIESLFIDIVNLGIKLKKAKILDISSNHYNIVDHVNALYTFDKPVLKNTKGSKILKYISLLS
jgi:hypothetical protein